VSVHQGFPWVRRLPFNFEKPRFQNLEFPPRRCFGTLPGSNPAAVAAMEIARCADGRCSPEETT
jgi:hypothetical protein